MEQARDFTSNWVLSLLELEIISFRYGAGVVILSGVHPEIEEDSDRDSTNFASSLPDSGSDWGWFMAMVENALHTVGISENLGILNPDKQFFREVYDISGRRLHVPGTGIFIVKYGGSFKKVLVIPHKK